MQASRLISGAATATSRRTHSFVGSSPRTKLPFLTNVVKKAQTSANTVIYKSTPSSSSGGDVALAPQSFKSYPLLRPGETKQADGSTLLYKDDTCVLVNDAFPKSTVHCLVMPLELRLDSLNALTRKDVPLLRHMIHVGNEYTRFLKTASPKLYGKRRFISGFHALPSLPMLHMHVLSMDLDSVCLKTKKHYNSFATFFFLTSDRVVDDVERHGRVTINQDVTQLRQMEEQEMKCLWCGAELANIPTMKAHVRSCAENKSLEK